MASDRLTLALPIDTARLFDSTVSQALIDADTFQNSPDDDDLLASMIEDAEAEFYDLTDGELRIERQGLSGQRETYETVTYKLNGHQQYKSNFSGVTSDYLPQEVNTSLDKSNVLPFDADAGDEAYLYTGLGGKTTAGAETWTEITEELVREIEDSAYQEYVNQLLDQFTEHHHLVYEAVYEMCGEGEKSIQTGLIYDKYKQLCQSMNNEALSNRRISDYIKHLELLGIIKADYYYGGEKGKTREIKLD